MPCDRRVPATAPVFPTKKAAIGSFFIV